MRLEQVSSSSVLQPTTRHRRCLLKSEARACVWPEQRDGERARAPRCAGRNRSPFITRAISTTSSSSDESASESVWGGGRVGAHPLAVLGRLAARSAAVAAATAAARWGVHRSQITDHRSQITQ